MAPPQAVPKEVIDLVEHFERDADAFRSPTYNEAQLRHQFLDPFFEALGWDVNNRQRHAEAYKDVIHEDAIKIGGETKAPDYCFRIGGTRKFFVEAKKPALNLKDDPAPAFQLRRYAWSSRLPLSVLTDFQELALYDCRIKPLPRDKASAARIRYFTCRDYVEHWDEIAGILSKDAVLQGSFDRFVEAKRLKRGTAQVDDAFLQEIEEWRKDLASNLAARNLSLTQRQVNFAVQRTIDRIIFLRICEDRGIETYGQLRKLADGSGIYRDLCAIFERADEKYNSGLFHFHAEKERAEQPDTLTLKLSVDDEKLKRIFKRLYYPDSPYEFSVLPADILGQVYEQFLGKVIRLTEGHHARVEDKPEVKKAGGVYYTPTYIVDYIVRHTVGQLLNPAPPPAPLGAAERSPALQRWEADSMDLSSRASAKEAATRGGRTERDARDLGVASKRAPRQAITPKQTAKLRILDPACGSGSFLIGAYQYLLDWHRDWYVSDGPEKHRKELYQGAGGDWRLTISEKKRILRNNIYGVDIDSQAVEVTKLSLLLKVLEGESEQTLNTTLRLFHERALPDLGSNIKCGNSLIGSDFYHDQQLLLLDEEDRLRINVFDWEGSDGFPEIVRSGGFDAVIGNPPWGAFFDQDELEYLRYSNRAIIVRMIDSFMYFVYQCSQKVAPDGYLGMIIPDVFLYQEDNRRLREWMLRNTRLHFVLNMGDVFHKVTRPACVIVAQNSSNAGAIIQVANLCRIRKAEKHLAVGSLTYELPLQSGVLDLPASIIPTINTQHYDLWSKVTSVKHVTLADLVDGDGIQRGVSPDLKEAFLVDSATVKKAKLETSQLRPVLTGGKHVRRFHIRHPDLLVIYTADGDNIADLPNIRRFIDGFRDSITCKEVKQKKHSLYALHRARDPRIFEKESKLLGVITEDRIVVATDIARTYATDGLYIFGTRSEVNSEFLLGVLNSRLFVFLYRLLALESGRVLAQVKPTVIARLPIAIDTNGEITDQVGKLSRRMAALTGDLERARTDHERTALQRQVDATDGQIDQLVYQLYGLTEQEIALVESATAPSPATSSLRSTSD